MARKKKAVEATPVAPVSPAIEKELPLENKAVEVKDPVVEVTDLKVAEETLPVKDDENETPPAPVVDEDEAGEKSTDQPPADSTDAPVVPSIPEDAPAGGDEDEVEAPANVQFAGPDNGIVLSDGSISAIQDVEIAVAVPPVVDTVTVPGNPPADEVLEPVVLEKETITKPISDWTLDEVIAFVKGDALKTGAVSEKAVVEHGLTFAHLVDANWEHWGFKDTFDWLKKGTIPKATTGGLYKRDPGRLNKAPHEWTEEELVGFLKGELTASKNAQAEDLVDMVRVKWAITQPWSDAEVKEYVLLNRKPLLTENGYWKNDVVREQKPAKYWTTNELKAFAAGEIDSTVTASESDLWMAVRSRLGLTQDFPIDRLQQQLAEYKEEVLPMSLQFVRHNLDRYQETMGKGVAVTEAGAGVAQGLLYNTVGRVLRLNGQTFVDGLTMILDFIHIHRTTMFDERHSYRGVGEMNSSDRDRRNHEQLLNLLIKTSNPETRYSEAKNTNFQAALNGITDEEVRQRVLSYYQIG